MRSTQQSSITLPHEMAETVRRMLASFDPAIAAAPIDLAATFTNRFVGV